LKISAMQPVFRFAPSPNGYLHLGHAYSALENAREAAQSGGRFLVRLEDIDLARCPEPLVEAALEDLAWLGLAWEQPVLRQSQHFARYAVAIAQLEAQDLLYPCFCSRGTIAQNSRALPRDPDGAPLYAGTCRALSRMEIEARLASGAPHALRLDLAKALNITGDALDWEEAGGRHLAMPQLWGDVVIKRKDVPTSYHLSVVLDDARQGITHVVRGRDLLAATAIHRVLQVLLGLFEPRYRHHALILGADGQKLAKSLASTPIRHLRGEGRSASEIKALVGF
jgi:glutamyl-Q tRNA(Asp) synthetase